MELSVQLLMFDTLLQPLEYTKWLQKYGIFPMVYKNKKCRYTLLLDSYGVLSSKK